MKITILAENSVCKTNDAGVKPEHGLSMYIELAGTNILFDTGQSDLFVKNAEKLGIDLSDVDFLIISHGHYDHGGGLKSFFELNYKAKVFMHKEAADRHYVKLLGFLPHYIGIDSSVIKTNLDRIIYIQEDMQIADNITIVSDFTVDFPKPRGNLSLYKKVKGRMIHDNFNHEIALLVAAKESSVLFTGCSHSGIINMYNRAATISSDKRIDYVFGGFHTYDPVKRRNESKEYLDKLIEKLAETGSVFYTGHCTGRKNYSYIKERLKKSIHNMNTGNIFHI